MSKFVRIGVYYLIVCMLITAFTGCQKGDGNESKMSNDSVASDSREWIVSDGAPLYTVVYPRNASNIVKEAMERFVSAIEEATSVTIITKTDEIKRGALYNSSTPEILFGRTDYSETNEVLKELEDSQFTLRRVGNKLVIVSPKDVNLDVAVTYFCDHMLEQNLKTEASGKKSLIMFEDYTSEIAEQPTVNDIQIGSHKLSEHVIVYDADHDGYMAVASDMRSAIEDKYGIRIPVYADRHYEDKGGPEILIGETDRTASASAYAGAVELMTYKVVVAGNKVQICSGGPFSARQCAEDLVPRMKRLSADGEYLETDLAPTTRELAENADVRIMTSNVLAARWGEYINGAGNSFITLPTVERAEIFAALLTKCRPDVVGMQEACDIWNEKLPEYLEILKEDYGLEYTWMHNSHNGKMSMTSVLYRSDKYNVVDSDYQPVSYWDAEEHGYYIRSFAWVKLQERDHSQNEFILVNTHWELSARVEKVQLCLQEETTLINSLYAQHNVPIICTGDFNSKQDTEDYVKFISGAALKDMLTDAETNGGRMNRAGGCGNPGQPRSNSGNYIDHIYSTSECTGWRFETVLDNMAYFMTDHSPMIADIQFTIQ
ncbi:MAG: endonuclease/exonuclease/phosphatase family protein [Eubacteriales bacterium]